MVEPIFRIKKNKMKNKHGLKLFIFWLFVCSLILPFAAEAQTAKPKVELPHKVVNLKLNSKLMAREMPYRLILPVNYQNSNEKTFYPILYLLHGLTGHFDNWTDKTKLTEYAAKYNYIIVMPEGDNGWFTDSATVFNDRYESYIIKELIPEIEKNYRVKTARENRLIAGLSMGGYGAIKFGLKYPEMFAVVGSFSGALGAALWTEKELGGNTFISKTIMSVYGAADSKTRRENEIFQIVREMPADKIKSLPFIYLDCGTEDMLYRSNRDFANLLQEKKVPHEFRELPGGHNWIFWDSQIQEFLELSEKFIK